MIWWVAVAVISDTPSHFVQDFTSIPYVTDVAADAFVLYLYIFLGDISCSVTVTAVLPDSEPFTEARLSVPNVCVSDSPSLSAHNIYLTVSSVKVHL